jgi:kynureninase
MDADDPLRSFRDLFHIPKGGQATDVIYLAGHSLGLKPKVVNAFIVRELEKWGTLGVAGHFEGRESWIQYHEIVRDSMAKLVGGLQHEVVVMNSLTVNLHLMMTTFFRPSEGRSRILIESPAFPSDRYAVESQLIHHGLDPQTNLIELAPRAGEHSLRTDDILSAISGDPDRIALILLGGVNYFSGQVLDMRSITESARAFGIPIGFDLAHAVGNVPLRLHDWGPDFAVWCSYKYLNAGPGGIAGSFVHERHARNRSLPRLAGWWGHDPSSRFSMPRTFDATDSADGWQLSNPPILSLASLRASLEIFEDAGMDRLREKSLLLSAFLRELLAELNGPFEIITPAEPDTYGCQVSLLFKRNGRQIFDALGGAGVRCDYRNPDVVRVAPVPLYNSFSDIVRFGAILQDHCG